jgi:hypothetical protein
VAYRAFGARLAGVVHEEETTIRALHDDLGNLDGQAFNRDYQHAIGAAGRENGLIPRSHMPASPDILSPILRGFPLNGRGYMGESRPRPGAGADRPNARRRLRRGPGLGANRYSRCRSRPRTPHGAQGRADGTRDGVRYPVCVRGRRGTRAVCPVRRHSAHT